MKHIFLLVLIFTQSLIFAQNKLNGVLMDSKSNMPIKFANVYTATGNNGVYSDQQGRFSIVLEKNDTLVFSAIGYETLHLNNNGLTHEEQKVYLKPISYKIDEVTFNQNSNIKKYEHTLGYVNYKKATTLIAHSGAEYVVFIPNVLKNEALLSKVILNLHAKRRSRPVFQIHMYSVDTVTGLPGKELLKKDLIETIIYQKNIKKYTIKDENIIMPKNGLFVGIEWIGELKNGTLNADVSSIQLSIPITFKLDTSYTYTRSSHYSNNWIRTSDSHPLSVILKKDTPPNAAFGIQVITYE